VDIFRALGLSHYRWAFENENIADRPVLRPILRETSLSNLAGLVVFVSISVALYFIFRREIPGGSSLGRYWIYIVIFTFNRYAQPSSMWFAHLWSLSLEEQFYLVWPWLVFFLPINWLKSIARRKDIEDACMIFDLCNARPEPEQLPGQAERQNRKSV